MTTPNLKLFRLAKENDWKVFLMMLLSDLAASDRLDSGCLVADPRTTSLFVRVSLAHRHATPSYRRTSPIPYASQVKEVLEEKGATWAGQCYKIGVVKKIFSELAVSITKAEDLLNQHQLANVAMQIQQVNSSTLCSLILCAVSDTSQGTYSFTGGPRREAHVLRGSGRLLLLTLTTDCLQLTAH